MAEIDLIDTDRFFRFNPGNQAALWSRVKAVPMSFAMKTGFCLLLAGCLCLGVGCASVKPAPAPRAAVVVPTAPDSALVRTVKD